MLRSASMIATLFRDLSVSALSPSVHQLNCHHVNRRFISTHSPDMPRDEGIALDEVLLLDPGKEGTSIRTAGSSRQITALLDGDMPLSEAVLPQTAPRNARQLTLFGD